MKRSIAPQITTRAPRRMRARAAVDPSFAERFFWERYGGPGNLGGREANTFVHDFKAGIPSFHRNLLSAIAVPVQARSAGRDSIIMSRLVCAR